MKMSGVSVTCEDTVQKERMMKNWKKTVTYGLSKCLQKRDLAYTREHKINLHRMLPFFQIKYGLKSLYV